MKSCFISALIELQFKQDFAAQCKVRGKRND